jgi:hypothetical protein
MRSIKIAGIVASGIAGIHQAVSQPKYTGQIKPVSMPANAIPVSNSFGQGWSAHTCAYRRWQ